MLDRKDLTLSLDDFRTIFHLPQATDNNHTSFVPPPSFSDMIPFYKQHLGFTMELKMTSSFKITGLLQPWQTLCKIFSKCLTTRVTGWDQPPLQIMMYAKVFGIDVTMTQSQPTESTQGTHRTPSTPRHITSLAEHKSREEQEAIENVALVDEHLASKEIEKIVEGSENVVNDSSPLRNDDTNIPGTRLEPMSDKESLEVEITADKVMESVDKVVESVDKEVEITGDKEDVNADKPVEIASDKPNLEEEITNEDEDITNVVIPVNVDEDEDEITDEVYELKRREKGKVVEESRISPIPTPTRSPRNLSNLISSDTEKLQELTITHTTPSSSSPNTTSIDQLADNLHDVMVETLPSMVKTHVKEQVIQQVPEQAQIQKAIDDNIPSLVDASVRSYMSGHILHVHPTQSQSPSVPEQQYQLYLAMKADPQLQQQDIAIWLALQIKFERTQVSQTACKTSAVRPRDQDDPHDDAHPKGENSAKRQKTSDYGAYVSGESSSGQAFHEEQAPSTSGNQEQDDDFDFWTNSYATDDDDIPAKVMLQDIMEEVSLTIDEAELKKMADEIKKEILVSPHPRKTTPLVLCCQRDPEAPALSLINQDLLYLKKGNSGPEKIVLSLHKFPAVIFNDDDIEERTSRWVNKCVRKFNPYARYGVEHWKNPHAKIFYIRKQKEPGRPKEEIYSNSKIIQVVKTYWELGHEHKFITEIAVRRANNCIVSITEPDYKNLNKNDIEDIYLLIVNGKKVNLIAPTISFPGIKEHEVFSIIYEPVHGIIYKNSKKEKRVMRHSEIHKFCDATLNRVLEGLKSYNNYVKHGYVQRELTSDEVEYLKLFEEEVEDRLKYRRQMRRWEMYVNGRPLGSRRDRLE
ncbi:hypothetical protein Tco_0340368 [Tanacetum coccineum]